MPTPRDDLLDSFHSRAIRTRIGGALRTLFVPTEPPPKRLLELLHALDQAKEGDTRGTEDTRGNKLKDSTRGQFADQKRGKRPAEIASPLEDSGVTKKRHAHAKRLSHISENERIEKIPGGYVVRDANGQALVFVYRGANESEALQANLLTADEALQIAIKIAKLRSLH